MVCTWCAHGVHMTCTWCAHDVHMVCTYHVHMVCTWYAHGMHMQPSRVVWVGNGTALILTQATPLFHAGIHFPPLTHHIIPTHIISPPHIVHSPYNTLTYTYHTHTHTHTHIHTHTHTHTYTHILPISCIRQHTALILPLPIQVFWPDHCLFLEVALPLEVWPDHDQIPVFSFPGSHPGLTGPTQLFHLLHTPRCAGWEHG